MEDLVSTMPMPLSSRYPRPNSSPQSGLRVAPPQDTSSSPWAALLDQSFAAGDCTWVMGADGVLLPVPTGDADAAPRRRAALRWRRS
jgi:hypothetical protein